MRMHRAGSGWATFGLGCIIVPPLLFPKGYKAVSLRPERKHAGINGAVITIQYAPSTTESQLTPPDTIPYPFSPLRIIEIKKLADVIGYIALGPY